MGYLVIASVITFVASGPFLWIAGNGAVVLMAVSIVCLAPIPVLFGLMAVGSQPQQPDYPQHFERAGESRA